MLFAGHVGLVTTGFLYVVHEGWYSHCAPAWRNPVTFYWRLRLTAGETFTQVLDGPSPTRDAYWREHSGRVLRCAVPETSKRPGFWTAHEVFRTKRGTTFDAVGVPPDIAVPVFAGADVADGMDPAMMKAWRVG